MSIGTPFHKSLYINGFIDNRPHKTHLPYTKNPTHILDAQHRLEYTNFDSILIQWITLIANTTIANSRMYNELVLSPQL